MTKIAKALMFLLAVAALIFAFATGYWIGGSKALVEDRRFIDWNGSSSKIRDAIERWGRKTAVNSEQAMEGRYARVMFFPHKNCIELALEPGSVGGAPICCYQAGTLRLVEEYSNVE